MPSGCLVCRARHGHFHRPARRPWPISDARGKFHTQARAEPRAGPARTGEGRILRDQALVRAELGRAEPRPHRPPRHDRAGRLTMTHSNKPSRGSTAPSSPSSLRLRSWTWSGTMPCRALRPQEPSRPARQSWPSSGPGGRLFDGTVRTDARWPSPAVLAHAGASRGRCRHVNRCRAVTRSAWSFERFSHLRHQGQCRSDSGLRAIDFATLAGASITCSIPTEY